MSIPQPCTRGRTETLQLTYIPQVLEEYIQYQYLYWSYKYLQIIGSIYISNTNVYITKFLFPPAWRANRNLSTDICPPSVSRIYLISIYIEIGYILDIYECWTYKYSQIVGSIFNTNVYFPQQGAWRHTETLQLTYIPQLLAEYIHIQYQFIYSTY